MVLSLSKKQESTTSKESSGNNPPPGGGNSTLTAEIRAGLMVSLAALVLLGLLIVSSRAHFLQPVNTRKIVFGYIGGLTKSAPVHFAGHNVGKVESIRFIPSPKMQVEVMISVAKNAPIRKDSGAYIDALGFMGEKYVEITIGKDESPLLGEGDIIHGTDPVPMMEMIKKGNEIMDEFQKTTSHLKKLTDDLSEIVGGNREELDGMIKNLDATSGNLKDMTSDIKTHPWKLLRKS